MGENGVVVGTALMALVADQATKAIAQHALFPPRGELQGIIDCVQHHTCVTTALSDGGFFSVKDNALYFYTNGSPTPWQPLIHFHNLADATRSFLLLGVPFIIIGLCLGYIISQLSKDRAFAKWSPQKPLAHTRDLSVGFGVALGGGSSNFLEIARSGWITDFLPTYAGSGNLADLFIICGSIYYFYKYAALKKQARF